MQRRQVQPQRRPEEGKREGHPEPEGSPEPEGGKPVAPVARAKSQTGLPAACAATALPQKNSAR